VVWPFLLLNPFVSLTDMSLSPRRGSHLIICSSSNVGGDLPDFAFFCSFSCPYCVRPALFSSRGHVFPTLSLVFASRATQNAVLYHICCCCVSCMLDQSGLDTSRNNFPFAWTSPVFPPVFLPSIACKLSLGETFGGGPIICSALPIFFFFALLTRL